MPVVTQSVPEQILYILERRETHAHADRIHDPIHPLVEIGILPKEKPQAEELGRLLRDGRSEEGLTESIPERMDLLRKQSEVQ